MTTQHTPGPWTLDATRYLPHLAGSSIHIQADGLSIAKVWSSEVAEADARLIAAAPDLLAALQDAVNICEQTPVADFDSLKRFRQVIAKAEGTDR